jgi:hypothetical protein
LYCDHLALDGKCTGQYKGFSCIKDKCKADKRKPCEFSTPDGFYCLKYRRFECVGAENCGTLEQYMDFVKQRREKTRP